MSQPAQTISDDGLTTPEAGAWGEAKYRLLAHYATMFTGGMQYIWDNCVYLDLFCGPGRVRFKDGRMVETCAMLAAKAAPAFDGLYYADADQQCLATLRQRISQVQPSPKAHFFEGDANTIVSRVLEQFPRFSRNNTGLTFCLLDPFRMENLRFSTVEYIARQLLVDFMVLIPSFMDANRNQRHYTERDGSVVDAFLGTDSWRAEMAAKGPRTIGGFRSFGTFLADQYGRRMRELGFLYDGMKDAETVTNTEHTDSPLYHLMFFSRGKRGLDFWRKTRRNVNPQLSLDI